MIFYVPVILKGGTTENIIALWQYYCYCNSTKPYLTVSALDFLTLSHEGLTNHPILKPKYLLHLLSNGFLIIFATGKVY